MVGRATVLLAEWVVVCRFREQASCSPYASSCCRPLNARAASTIELNVDAGIRRGSPGWTFLSVLMLWLLECLP